MMGMMVYDNIDERVAGGGGGSAPRRRYSSSIADCRPRTRVLPWRELRRKRTRKRAVCGANKIGSF